MLSGWKYSPLGHDIAVLRKLHRGGRILFALNFLLLVLAWAFLPLHNEKYQSLRARRKELFPQIQSPGHGYLDSVRALVQLLFLLIFPTPDRTQKDKTLPAKLTRLFNKDRAKGSRFNFSEGSLPKPLAYLLLGLVLFVSGVLAFICITQPLELSGQLLFITTICALAFYISKYPSKQTLALMIVISTIMSARYIWWRYANTANTETHFDFILSLLLLFAETYAFLVMILGYFQISWPLERKPYPLPEDSRLWPTVDVMIPTYNEPLEVVRGTVLAAKNMDWPADKLKVYILDDGKRADFAEFAETAGVGYITREEHKHAKAGNINHALSLTDGDLVAIFDCDHIPVRAFLQLTCGWLVKNPKIGFVQTPHHFYSKDPFEKNLRLNKEAPHENAFFHNLIQKGNDAWNSTFFCGSCAVLRRKALEEVGGIAVETVTEDAHTSLKLNRKGWSSAFISIPLAAGLATESLSAHIGQRIRWARGMIQIFRIDNPFFKKGLSLGQRICFFNGMLHFLHGLPRIIFLLAPLPYLFGNIYVIYATGIAIFSYMVPHLFLTIITGRSLERNNRQPFLNSIYETVLCWYIFIPTTIALIFPKFGKFNVTVKGGVTHRTFMDKSVAFPFLILFVLNAAAFIYGIYRLFVDNESFTILINLCWVFFNLLLLLASITSAVETVQRRHFQRISFKTPVSLSIRGFTFAAQTLNFSLKGALVETHCTVKELIPNLDEVVTLHFDYNERRYSFDAVVRSSSDKGILGLEMLFNKPGDEQNFIGCTFGRSDMWSEEEENRVPADLPTATYTLFSLADQGLLSLAKFSPRPFRLLLSIFQKIISYFFGFFPRRTSVGLAQVLSGGK